MNHNSKKEESQHCISKKCGDAFAVFGLSKRRFGYLSFGHMQRAGEPLFKQKGVALVARRCSTAQTYRQLFK